ncbi:PREDICTED: cytochrome P450 2U1-like [Priapulus caudatus]|uniref:Cytochrome P450 2U1-like n=1 Tax=Priapulus caudatus TaxID=37621 RepID=A0ABM1EBY6_PRICU|nr:PREDICTED: cytochrome P450 2U1-like [Priapulus caudatus]
MSLNYLIVQIARWSCDPPSRGISLATGRKWKENRQFTIKALARLGVADRSVESRIVREVDSLLSVMATVDSHLFNPAVICSCIANVMCDIIFGRRYAHDDPEMMKYVAEMQEGFVLMAHLGILNFLPALRHLPMTRKPLARLNVTKAAAHSFFANHVREHMATFDPENIRDFIDTYLEEARKRAQVDANCNLLEDDYVLHLVGDLFGSGFVTTAHTIIWGLLYMSRHGDVQRRVQAEIGEQIGEGRAPNLADMSELPYTVAVVHEVLRFKTVAPLGVPHANTKDLVVRGYHIPKGTFIMPLLHAVHHSEMHWKNPTEFDPTNFLDSDGRLKIPSAFMPFSSGKRICPGGQLAMYETFLFLASILQRFTVTLPEGAPVPDLIGKLGVTLAPPTFDLLITAR